MALLALRREDIPTIVTSAVTVWNWTSMQRTQSKIKNPLEPVKERENEKLQKDIREPKWKCLGL